MPAPEAYLWMEVLRTAIVDATEGVSGPRREVDRRMNGIVKARTFLTEPNEDFEIVCALAGVDSDAFRERAQVIIGKAPSPEELVQPQSGKRKGKTLTLNGVNKTISEWSEHLGISTSTIHLRKRQGLPIELVLSPKSNKGRKPKCANEQKATCSNEQKPNLANEQKATCSNEDQPGVGSDFLTSLGTGGGRSAQDSTKIDFPELEGAT